MVRVVTSQEAVTVTLSGAHTASVTIGSNSVCVAMAIVGMAMRITVLLGRIRRERSEMMDFHLGRPELIVECPIR